MDGMRDWIDRAFRAVEMVGIVVLLRRLADRDHPGLVLFASALQIALFAWLFIPVAYAMGFRVGTLWRTLRPVPFVLLSIVTLAITAGGGLALGRAIDVLATIEVSHPDG